MSALVKTARQFLGVPFKHRGRNPTVGFDCAGFPRHCYLQHGIEIPDSRKYGREPHNDKLVDACITGLGEPVAVAPVVVTDLQVGDVCIQRFEIYPHHLFIVGDYYLGGLSCIHADGSQGKYSRVLECRLDDTRISLITHVFRKPI